MKVVILDYIDSSLRFSFSTTLSFSTIILDYIEVFILDYIEQMIHSAYSGMFHVFVFHFQTFSLSNCFRLIRKHVSGTFVFFLSHDTVLLHFSEILDPRKQIQIKVPSPSQ